MFGGQGAFGSTNPGGFGSTNAFGAAPNTSVFGTTAGGFGSQANKPAFGGTTFGGGGLFGSSNTSSTGGLFGGTNTTTSSFGGGGGGFGQPASTSFGGGGFGQTTQSGGLFGSTSTSQSGGLFSQPTPAFGAAGNSGFGGSSFGFGGTAQAGTAHAKFSPVTGTDTMMKGGVQTTISTSHQCIVCMKEYENKSMEELRYEDYMAGRKGTAGAPSASTGLFGAAQQPAAGGGLFGSQPASSSGGLFGQASKPLFGTSGFGGTATSAAPAFGSGNSAFSQTSQPGGLFGAAKPFGQTTTSTTGFGGFGQQQQATSGGLFGQQNKPFGSVAPQPAGGLFGASTTTPLFGTSTANTSFGGFGQQQQPQQQQQSIGLFGANNTQAKPAFGFGTTPAASAVPAFGGFGTTTTSQSGGGLFGSTAAKPAFGGFGATTSQPSTGFGGFGTSTAGGGLFGSNQAKPAFSFGGTSTANTGFGGFGTSTSGGGGLFGSTAKPGGLFGTTTNGFGSCAGFGTGTSAFGSTGTSAFGTGGGLNFGSVGTFTNQGAAPAAPAASSVVQQQLLLALASSPFGENPLFKQVPETGRRAEVLKPGSTPAGQKDLSANQFKVSPHRNIKVRAKAVDSLSKNLMFEGLEEDLPSSSEMFTPRSSIKKLVLRPKKTGDMTSNSLLTTLGDDPSQETSLTVHLDESGLAVKKAEVPLRTEHDTSGPVDDSFMALNTRKKVAAEATAREEEDEEEEGLQNTSLDSRDTDKEDEAGSHPGGITLKRSGYYTIPPLQDILADTEGNCVVEGFTIGREGYGNIHYPGNTNITGLNLDEIVFFRHKEVIVYPDDGNKPLLGEGLNKKAQITLDKVWPADKGDAGLVKSPERLRAMNYEEKLIRASNRLGARFIEYRPETGSWVFRVDHFSKYGLEDSDEEEGLIVPPGPDNSKRMKTLHLEKRRSTLDKSNPGLESRTTLIHTETLDNERSIERVESDGSGDSEERDVEMNDVSSLLLQQKTFIRSALFSDGLDEGEMIECPPAKPVILQRRITSNSVQETRSRLLDDMSGSILSVTNKGLGGSYLLGEITLSASLLRSHYSTQTSLNMSSGASTTLQQSRNMSSKLKNSRLPSYSLTGGYDKFTQLTSGNLQDQVEVVLTPQHLDTEIPLHSSFLHNRFKQIADAGLFHNKRFRVGFHRCWEYLENPGGGFLNFSTLESSAAELESLEKWLKVSLETSEYSVDESGPLYRPVESIQTLHSYYLQSIKQYQDCTDEEMKTKNWETKHMWDLMVALWGRVEEEDTEEVIEEEVVERVLENHSETMHRRTKFSGWLQRGVEVSSARDVLTARERNSSLGKVCGMLSAGEVETACDSLQAAGDHRSALLLAQLGGGGATSRLVQQQLDRWTEVKADKYIAADRIRLFSLVAGQPVHQGTEEPVNTCSKLDWQRSLAHHLWYLTHPLSSVSDALENFDAAWQGSQPYCSRPLPRYCEDAGEDDTQALDVKYHLIKLYSDRSHKLERVLAPTTHTPNQMTFRTSWFLYRVARSLGYSMASSVSGDRLCTEFSSELEHLGLWTWAVFVLLHVEDRDLRKTSVMRVLERCVSLEGVVEEEDWLTGTLGVPATWVAKARAVLARVKGKHEILAEQLIQAEDYDEAHKVIISEIAPSAILRQHYSQLEQFLRRLADINIAQKVFGWESEGLVYLQFVDVDTAVNRFLQRRDIDNLGYELERLKPMVTSLCRTISNLPVNNTRQRLAQSEIAKKAAHFMRAVYSFESSSGVPASTTARQLAESLSTLPLPEDYALQELRTLTRSYLAEIMES